MKYILQTRIVSKIVLCVFVILIGCKESQDDKKNVVDYFTISNFSTKKIKIDRLIDMDSLKINGNKMSNIFYEQINKEIYKSFKA